MKRAYRVERLARREEKQIIKRIFTLSLLSVVIIVVIITLGIPTLGKFADFLNTVFKRNPDMNQQIIVLAPPHFDKLPKTTNQETLTITGFTLDGTKVQLYLNGQQHSYADIKDGKFEFDNVKLSNGENKIKARVADNSDKTSDFSNEETVVLDTLEPFLEVTSPVDGQTFSGDNRIKVRGKAEKDTQVFANNFLANVDSSGNFEVAVPLPEGDNTIEVKAQDEAGNAKTIQIKVSFKK